MTSIVLFLGPLPRDHNLNRSNKTCQPVPGAGVGREYLLLLTSAQESLKLE